jgi:phosphoglycolate phosphatase-like HAD superfamily hydrolase
MHLPNSGMKPKKLVIGFDLDGTLIDSIPLHKEAFILGAKAIGIKLVSKDFFKAGSTTATNMIRNIKPSISEEELRIFTEKRTTFINSNLDRLKPFNDTVKVMNELHRRSRILIFSNCDFKEILVYLEAVKLNPLFFDVIIGKDLVDEPKPSPEEILLAEKLERHRIDYYIGDSVVDIITGRRAKVKTIAVSTGFNTARQLGLEKPYIVIPNLSALLDIIR